MDIFQKLAEQKILEAMERGEFDNLPNRGMPLSLAEDAWLPEDLRMAYKVLKNAGCLPPELELRKEILSLRTLVNTLDDDTVRLQRIRELNFKVLKLNMMRKSPLQLEEKSDYEIRVIDKLTRERKPSK
jgi:hypothetical protein